MPVRHPQHAPTRGAPTHARPRRARTAGPRTLQLGSVLAVGAMTAVLAWSGTAQDASPATGPASAPATSSPAAPAGKAESGASGAGGTAAEPVRPDGGEATGRTAAAVDAVAAAPGTPGPDDLTVPVPPAAALPTADYAAGTAGGDAVPVELAGDPVGDPAPATASAPAGTAGTSAGGPLAGRTLAEVLGPEGAVAWAPPPLRPPAPGAFDLTVRSVDDPASTWVVVNKVRPLVPADYAPDDLVAVQGYEVRAVAAEPLTALLAAAAADGVPLVLRSAYRSADYQQAVHGAWAERVGETRADEVSARAGHSEHQTGLAVDVGSTSRPGCDFQDCFDETAEGAWLAAHAAEHGFLVRYTAATQDVTGFAPEGWHLRYVGSDLLAEMDRRGVATLEELFGLPGGPDYA